MIKIYNKFLFMLFYFYFFWNLKLPWIPWELKDDWMYIYDSLVQVIHAFIQSFDLPWSNFSPISLLQILKLELKFGGMCFYGHVFVWVHFKWKRALNNTLKPKAIHLFSSQWFFLLLLRLKLSIKLLAL